MLFQFIVRRVSLFLPLSIKSKFRALLPKSLLSYYRNIKSDYYLISYPKCGRTWLRLMIGEYLVRKYKLNNVSSLDLQDIHAHNVKIPKIIITHDNQPHKNSGKLKFNRSKYSDQKILFLIRDPRDVIVSLYFHLTKRSKIELPSLSEYIHDKNKGFENIIEYYNLWMESQYDLNEFLIIKYEDLHDDTNQEVKKVLDFFGIEVEEELIEDVVNFSSFDNMKKMEARNFFDSDFLKTDNNHDNDAFKTRKGEVGGFEEIVSSDDINYMNSVMIEKLNPAFDYNK